MAITAQDVKNLREMTGVGMMDCKKALAASEGVPGHNGGHALDKVDKLLVLAHEVGLGIDLHDHAHAVDHAYAECG